MPLAQWKEELQAQAGADVDEIIHHFNHDLADSPTIRRGLMLCWLAGAQWGVQEGADRVAALVPDLIAHSIQELGRALESGDAPSPA